MTKRMSTAEARARWADVVRSAERGTPIEVTRNGEPIAAVVSVEQLRSIERGTVFDVFARYHARSRPAGGEGEDPWADVRDESPGRDVELEP